jgi:hypothetical protein
MDLISWIFVAAWAAVMGCHFLTLHLPTFLLSHCFPAPYFAVEGEGSPATVVPAITACFSNQPSGVSIA